MEGNLDITEAARAIIAALFICLPTFAVMRKFILSKPITGVALYCLITFTLAVLYYAYSLDMF